MEWVTISIGLVILLGVAVLLLWMVGVTVRKFWWALIPIICGMIGGPIGFLIGIVILLLLLR